jgi:hypothetical protein
MELLIVCLVLFIWIGITGLDMELEGVSDANDVLQSRETLEVFPIKAL